MKLSDIKKATILATQRCFSSKVDVDIFESGTEYKVQLAAFRNSKKYVKRLSYEKGKVIIRDQQGKTIETVEASKPIPQKVAAATEKKAESKKD